MSRRTIAVSPDVEGNESNEDGFLLLVPRNPSFMPSRFVVLFDAKEVH
jgi:hypothetical protein